MTVQDIHRLVQEYISKRLEAGEEERHEQMPEISDDERESIIHALGDMLENAHSELLRRDDHGVVTIADDVLAAHSLTLAHDFPAYRRFCIEWVKAHQIVLKTEMEHGPVITSSRTLPPMPFTTPYLHTFNTPFLHTEPLIS